MKKVINALTGVLTGFINILIGSCGGIIAVESLKRERLNQTEAHATAIAVILPLSIISAVMYVIRGNVSFSDSAVYILPGLAGSAAGAFILPKIPKKLLSKVFSAFIIYAGVRMMFR